MRTSTERSVAMLFLACTGAACDEPLVERQTIAGLRILAAQVRSSTEPSRADLMPGEAGELRWLVASDRSESFSAIVEFCRTPASVSGLPACSGDVFERYGTEAEAPAEVSVPFVVPSSLIQGDEWLARIALCSSGTPAIDARGVGRCRGGTGLVEAFHRVRVDGSRANHNPNLADDRLELDGTLWEADAENVLVGSPCSELLPSIEVDKSVPITLLQRGDDREPVSADEGTAAREALVFSHLATIPGLSRPFSSIEPEDDDPSFELELHLDKDLRPKEEGQVFDFHLTVRDGRGGADWLRRRACARAR